MNAQREMTQLLPKDRRIIEKGRMEFQPFGRTADGKRIDDVSGLSIRVFIDCLEELITRNRGREAAQSAVEELVLLLNGRIPDPAYHVTPAFLKNPWNSYSHEFGLFLTVFCSILTEDPDFHMKAGKRHIHPIIQTLGRPFSVQQIFKMCGYFGSKYVKAYRFEPVQIEETRAIIRITYAEHSLKQFGPYRRACASQICTEIKGGVSAVPEAVHGLLPAKVTDRACVANDDPYCEWDIRWEPEKSSRLAWGALLAGTTLSLFIFLRFINPLMSYFESLLLSFLPALTLGALKSQNSLRRELRRRGEIITEQSVTTDARHEELREAYLEQEQQTADLRRRVRELTLLHQTGLLLTSTHDPDALISSALRTLINGLHFDRAVLSFYDAASFTLKNPWIIRVGEETAHSIEDFEGQVVDTDSVEGSVILRGQPILIREVSGSPTRLSAILETKAFIAVPLRVKDRILGLIMVGRLGERLPSEGDLEVMITFGNQLAVGLDNARAYREIEELNINLEAKVRQRTAELESANARLRDLDNLKSQFLAHVSHELRTPLTSIQGFADNLLDEIGGPLNTKQKQNLRRITANAGRLHRMISNLLDQSRIEAGKIQLSRSRIELTQLVEDVIEHMQPAAQVKRQTIDLACSDPHLTVWGDADMLRQIVTNLLDNAIKYTPPQGHIQMAVGRKEPGLAKLSVIDNGPGIPTESRSKVFEPFYRVEGDRGREVKGTGLGLSIVKRLIELHNGQVTLESEEGNGTSIHIVLPAIPEIIVESDEAAVPARRLLVVDDDPDIRQFLIDRLSGDGYALKAATNGQEAIALLSEESFDGAILDLGLPELNGVAVLKYLRSKNKNMPVLIITAAESRERAIQAVETGAQAYLLKPFNASQFERVVLQCFGKCEPDPTKGE